MSAKHLYLLRHAQTLERLSDQSDYDRELNTIGLQNSTRMGINFINQEYNFDIIICSPAVRAKTTAQLVAEQMKYDTDSIFYNDSLYDASIRNLLDIVNNLKPEWNSVLIIGHNPSISYLSEYICNADTGQMTTCGVVKIKFDSEWGEITQNSGEFVSYEYPALLNF